MRAWMRYPINLCNRRRLKNKNFSLITSNCTGGVVYHELGLRFLSPTINLYLESKDFIKLLSNLDYYCSDADMTIVDQSEVPYPVVMLDDIKLYCVHYKNLEHIQRSWYDRAKRIVKDNIFVMLTMRDGCTHEDLLAFDKLPFKNKVVFVNKPMPEIKSAYYIPGTELTDDIEWHSVEALTTYKGSFTGKRYVDDFDYVRFFNEGPWWNKD